MDFKRKLLTSIECLRQKMHEVANAYGINSPQALMISQRLDIALNHYYKLQSIPLHPFEMCADINILDLEIAAN
jgi:hypothetical protein